MCNHGIEIARADQKAERGSSKPGKIRILSPIRLGQNGHLVAVMLQKTGKDCRAKGRVIDVGVACYENESRLDVYKRQGLAGGVQWKGDWADGILG